MIDGHRHVREVAEFALQERESSPAERLGDDILRLTRVGSFGDIKPSDFCLQRRSARHSAWRIVTAKHSQSKHIKTNFTDIAEFRDFTSNLPGGPGLF
jgi:hypothetical protein